MTPDPYAAQREATMGPIYSDSELRQHAQAVADDPRSHYEPQCPMCVEARVRGITAEQHR